MATPTRNPNPRRDVKYCLNHMLVVMRWSRASALPELVQSLVGGVHLAHVFLFVIRQLGGAHVLGAEGGTLMVRRLIHSVAQAMEERTPNFIRRELGPTGGDDDSLSVATKKIPVVRSLLIANYFLSQPARGVMTVAAGGIPQCLGTGNRDVGEGAVAAGAFSIRHLIVANGEIMDHLARQGGQFPCLHISFDEARIYKRNRMAVIVDIGGTLVMAPTQIVADFVASGKSDSVKLQDLKGLVPRIDLASAIARRKQGLAGQNGVEGGPTYKSSFAVRKSPSIATFLALGNALDQLVGFSFSLTFSPAPLRPVGPHESRSVMANGWPVVQNTLTGRCLYLRE
jgi:hypothetical protein